MTGSRCARPIGDVKAICVSSYNFYNFLTSSLRLNGVIVPSIEVCPGENCGAGESDLFRRLTKPPKRLFTICLTTKSTNEEDTHYENI
jgi:hypothetical protein